LFIRNGTTIQKSTWAKENLCPYIVFLRRIHNIYKNKISILSGALLKLILVQIVEFVCVHVCIWSCVYVCRLKRPCMFKIKLCFIDGMLEVKVFGLNEMLPNLLSKILLEVNSFMSTDDSKYEVSSMLVWIIVQCDC
jgi:hypothetical protein